MSTYTVRRLLHAGPVLLLISICVFAIMEMAPGDPVRRIARRPGAISSSQMENLRREYGLDDPVPIRYLKWLGHAARGNLGYSYATRRSVAKEILDRLPNTIVLMAVAYIVVLIISVPTGIISAVNQYSIFDIVITTLAFVGQAIPAYLLGSMLIFIFHGLLKAPFSSGPLLPIGGMSSWGSDSSILDRLKHMILPIATLSFGWVSVYTRFVRSSTLDVLYQDFIVTARAKGLSESTVVLRHAFKNATLPLVTVIALDLPAIVAGALYVEIIFSWPGIGRLFYDAARLRDYPVLMGIAMMIAIAIVLCNLLADIAYAYLDPRVRFGKLRAMHD